MKNIVTLLLSRFTIFIIPLISSILLIESINSISMHPEIYNGKIFLSDITSKEYIQTLFIIISITFLLLYFNKKYSHLFLNFKKINICYILFFISFIFKALLYDLSFSSPLAQTNIIEKIFINGEYNSYKLYSYLVLFLYKVTDNYELYLGFINLLLGSMIPVFIYLISREIKQNYLISLFISSLVILFMPLSAVEGIYRIDVLYIFLFIASIYLSLITKHYKSYSFLLLIIVLILSCFAREQTLYLLPLYVFYFMFNDIKNKTIVISLLLSLIISVSLLISKFNETTYGSSSLYRDGILVIKIIQYGYLSNPFSSNLKLSLDDNQRKLYNGIRDSYHIHVLPHKREVFDNLHLPQLWYFIRPDKENINQKNHRSISGGNLELVRNEIIKEIDNYNTGLSNINTTDINKIIKNVMERLSGGYDKRMLLDIESIIINDILNDKTSFGDLKYDKTYCSNGIKINQSCLKYFLKSINEDYIYERSDLWFLKKAGLYDFALKYDPGIKRYTQPDNIHLAKNIILEKPMLYITQSLLTLTSMTGYFPVPANNGGFSKTLDESIVPKIFTMNLQKIYYLMINLWYLLCFLSLVYYLVCVKNKRDNLNFLFISIIPLYYGLFLSFATFNEFSRLMLPVVPFIFICFIAFLSQLISPFFDNERKNIMNRGQFKLIITMLIFILPFFVAYFMLDNYSPYT